MSAFTLKCLLIFGSRRDSSGYVRLLFMATSISGNFNFEVFQLLVSEVPAGNLGPSAIARSSYSVAMFSITSYEIDTGKIHES